jgi:hypothetical protein
VFQPNFSPFLLEGENIIPMIIRRVKKSFSGMKTFPQIFTLFLMGCFFFSNFAWIPTHIVQRMRLPFPLLLTTFEKHISAYLFGSCSIIATTALSSPHVKFRIQID